MSEPLYPLSETSFYCSESLRYLRVCVTDRKLICTVCLVVRSESLFIFIIFSWSLLDQTPQ